MPSSFYRLSPHTALMDPAFASTGLGYTHFPTQEMASGSLQLDSGLQWLLGAGVLATPLAPPEPFMGRFRFQPGSIRVA